MILSSFDNADIQAVAGNFPAYVQAAKDTWARFKLGEADGLFSSSERKKVLEWYAQFPKAWVGFRPNWTEALPGGTFSARQLAFADSTDAWVESLKRDLAGHGVEPVPVDGSSGLGLAFIIIAGIIILGLFGAAGAVWAVGYFKEQSNIARMVDDVTAGKLSASVLEKALARENSSAGVFGGAIDLLKWGVLAWALFQFGPMVVRGFKRNA